MLAARSCELLVRSVSRLFQKLGSLFSAAAAARLRVQQWSRAETATSVSAGGATRDNSYDQRSAGLIKSSSRS